MLPYYLLLALPLFYMISSQMMRYKLGKRNITYDERNVAMRIFFLWLLLLLICRDETIGRDLKNYKYIFRYSERGLKYVFYTRSEFLFRLYNWVVYQFTQNYQIYLAITAILTIVPIAYIYVQNKGHSYLKIVLFVNMTTFIMLFSGIRQSLAMAIGFVAYRFVKEKRLLPFLLWTLVAMHIHHSGFMILFMYPLYHVRLKKGMLPFIIPVIVLVFVFNKQIFMVLTFLLKDNSKYDADITATGAYASLVLFLLFAVFAYVITDEKQCDAETLGLRNFLLIAVLLQCFAPLHNLAMRMNYYYILFIPLAMGKCLTYPRKSMKQVAQLGEIVLCVYFTAVFVSTVYQSAMTGNSYLDTIPYKAFWN